MKRAKGVMRCLMVCSVSGAEANQCSAGFQSRSMAPPIKPKVRMRISSGAQAPRHPQTVQRLHGAREDQCEEQREGNRDEGGMRLIEQEPERAQHQYFACRH